MASLKSMLVLVCTPTEEPLPMIRFVALARRPDRRAIMMAATAGKTIVMVDGMYMILCMHVPYPGP